MPLDLLPGETLVAELHRHWVVLVRAVVMPFALLIVVMVAEALFSGRIPRDIGILLAVAAVAVAGLWLIVAWIRWTSSSITITDQRVLLANGIFSRQTKVIPLDRVQDVTTRQNLVGRMLSYGTVEVDAAGSSGAERIDHLPAPTRFRDEVFVHAGRMRGGGC